MRRPALLAATAGGLLALAVPSPAAPAPQVTDLAGDANGVNSQSLGLPLPGTATAPASNGAADIVSVTFATAWKKLGSVKVPNGVTVTMTLSGAPAEGTAYAVHAVVPKTCDGEHTDLSLSYLEYGLTRANYAQCHDASEVDGDVTEMLVEVTTDAARKTITWRLSKGIQKGAKVDSITADTSVFVLGVYDEATGSRAYTYGS